jgi:hypothetical protein
LLVHPEDTLPSPRSAEHWDLIVDCARTPDATYDSWRGQSGSHAISIFHLAEEIEDLYRLRELLQAGIGVMVDASGIDWWDVLSLEIVPQLLQFMLIRRLAKKLGSNCELYSSRPHFVATALGRLLGTRARILQTPVQSILQRTRHYREVFSQLDPAQLAQVLEDKFDNHHSIRRGFTRRGCTSGEPVILLPSAYINVSRAVLAYAKLLPDFQFLLVHTRRNGRSSALPENVRSASLTPYFVPADQREMASLLELWAVLGKQLCRDVEEINMAAAVGLFERIPKLLSWGIALRNAWSQVYESERVTACISADDSNPPSNIPLIMAKKRGIPAIACHHGALNYMMAVKTNHADFYLVKNEMERSYLRRICHLDPEKIVMFSEASSKRSPSPRAPRSSASWLVFFTEPYQNSGWRTDEVYCDLLPHLWSLAQRYGLKLVFKLHPFESIKGHRRMLRRLFPKQERQIDVLAGPISDELWNSAEFALTVQSSTAIECNARGIPIFLCAWLRDPYSGYIEQYARFGVGQVLESSEQIARIPDLLQKQHQTSRQVHESERPADSDKLSNLLSGVHVPVAINA